MIYKECCLGVLNTSDKRRIDIDKVTSVFFRQSFLNYKYSAHVLFTLRLRCIWNVVYMYETHPIRMTN